MRQNYEIELAKEYFDEACEKMDQCAYYEAIELATNALHLLKNSTEYGIYARTVTLLGVIYSTLGNENMSEDFYIHGLRWAMENNLKEYNHFFYVNLGTSYQNLNQHRKATHYFLLGKESLEKYVDKKEKSYRNWCLITDLNLMVSYIELQKYAIAEQYLGNLENQIDEEETLEDICYSVLLAKCLLFVNTYRFRYVETHCQELLAGISSFSASDFFENVNKLCRIFRILDKRDLWEQTLDFFQTYYAKQETDYFRIVLSQKWMEYYKYIQDEENYTKMCVNHSELLIRQIDIWKEERCKEFDTKLRMFEKEVDVKDAQHRENIDYLTGVGNRKLLEEEFEKVISQMSEKYSILVAGVIDIDHFKVINKTIGHLQGNECLKMITSVIRGLVDGYGKVYRYGSDKFFLLWATNQIETIHDLAENIRIRILVKGEEQFPECEESIGVTQGYVCWNAQVIPTIWRLEEETMGQLKQVKQEEFEHYKIKELRKE